MKSKRHVNEATLRKASTLIGHGPFLLSDTPDADDLFHAMEASVGEAWEEQVFDIKTIAKLTPKPVSLLRQVLDKFRSWNHDTTSWEYVRHDQRLTKKRLMASLVADGLI